MAIKWRPATKDDIGMPCRFHDGDEYMAYGKLREVCEQLFPFKSHTGTHYKFAEAAERERDPIEDPILEGRRFQMQPIPDVRDAVNDALRFWLGVMHDYSLIVDGVVERLPTYFRKPLYREVP